VGDVTTKSADPYADLMWRRVRMAHTVAVSHRGDGIVVIYVAQDVYDYLRARVAEPEIPITHSTMWGFPLRIDKDAPAGNVAVHVVHVVVVGV
jgi:hypothetical protein